MKRRVKEILSIILSIVMIVGFSFGTAPIVHADGYKTIYASDINSAGTSVLKLSENTKLVLDENLSLVSIGSSTSGQYYDLIVSDNGTLYVDLINVNNYIQSDKSSVVFRSSSGYSIPSGLNANGDVTISSGCSFTSASVISGIVAFYGDVNIFGTVNLSYVESVGIKCKELYIKDASVDIKAKLHCISTEENLDIDNSSLQLSKVNNQSGELIYVMNGSSLTISKSTITSPNKGKVKTINNGYGNPFTTIVDSNDTANSSYIKIEKGIINYNSDDKDNKDENSNSSNNTSRDNTGWDDNTSINNDTSSNNDTSEEDDSNDNDYKSVTISAEPDATEYKLGIGDSFSTNYSVSFENTEKVMIEMTLYTGWSDYVYSKTEYADFSNKLISFSYDLSKYSESEGTYSVGVKLYYYAYDEWRFYGDGTPIMIFVRHQYGGNGASNYSNEWRNGKWINADGSQTYGPTLSWKYNGVGWWIEDSSGWYPTSMWQKIDGYWYYFNASGYMASGEWVDGWWCNDDGSCTYGGVGSWHYGSGGWWYGDSTGWYASNTWQKIDGYWYYFKGDGYMATNQYVGGYWVGADGTCR